MNRQRMLALAAALVVALTIAPVTSPASQPAKPGPGAFLDFYPPAPFSIVVKQPDGTAFRGKLQPKEIGGHLETEDGYAVTKDEKSGVWYYAERAQGAKLFASKRVVGKDSPQGLPVGLGRHDSIWQSTKLGSMRDQTLRMLQMVSWKAQMQAAETGQLPLVFKTPFFLLATWYDKENGETEPQFRPGRDAEFFTKLLDGFGGNPTGTMTEFWLENSYGQFLVNVDVYGPYTSYRSLNNPCYYGNTSRENQQVAGSEVVLPGIGAIPRVDDGDPVGNFLGIGGVGAAGMAVELVPQADRDVDFGQYDNDKDGKVDFVGIIHSGADMAATGNPCDTWSHAIEITFAAGLLGPAGPTFAEKGGIPTADRNSENEPVVVDRVFTMPEIGANIGVAVHEMMHARGEPDYYNTSYTSTGSGDWDIMSGGSWFGNPPGSNPIGANPATRVFQGWVTPKIVRSDTRNVKIAPRSILPFAGYNATKVQPNIVLVPTAWTDSTAPEDIYGLPKDPANGKYITEGWYIENISRSVNTKPIHKDMTRAPYFDRYAHSSGLLVWQFDYYRKSNVYYGANDAQSDPNRPQMDPEEFDFNDNTQELQLNYTRGEPSDVWFGAATGMTSATRQNPPGVPTGGTPSEGTSGSGVTPPGGEATHEFTVPANPANFVLKATVASQGDCTLALEYKDKDSWQRAGSTDSGAAGDTETLSIQKPKPGAWRMLVGDFAACLNHEWTVGYQMPFFTTGAADTFTNTGSRTGWAFTNIGPRTLDGLEHSADSPGPEAISLDLLKLDGGDADASPGFVTGALTSTYGRAPIIAGRANRITVPIYNNGGKASTVAVQVRQGSAAGPVVGTTRLSLPGYSRREAHFNWTPASEGKYDLFTVVDPGNAVREASEANNVQETRMVVGPANPAVLIVDDDGSNDFEETYIGALTAAGVPWALASGHVDAATMRKYKAVVWEAGLDRYQGQLNALDRAEIAKYLNGGGRMWMTSTRLAAAMGAPPGSTNPGATPDMAEMLRDYFGATYVDTLQVGGGPVVGQSDESGIGGARSITTDILPGRPLQDVWTIASGDNASKRGEASAIFKYAKGGAGDHQGVRVVGNDQHKSFKTVYFGFNLKQVVLGSEQLRLTTEVMKYLGVPTGRYKPAVPLLWHSQQRSRVSYQAAPLVAYAFNMPAPKLWVKVHGGRVGDEPVIEPVPCPPPPATCSRARSQWESYPFRQDAPGVYQGIVLRQWVTPKGVDYFIDSTIKDPSGSPALAHYIGVSMPTRPTPARKPH